MSRILYVVSEDWYFLSHRLPMARAARDAGFDVHVATRVRDGGQAISDERFTLHPIPFVRGRLSPFAAWRTIAKLRELHANLRPDICHNVSFQTAVYGTLAALGHRCAVINSITGLGFTFIGNDAKTRLFRALLTPVVRWLFDRPRITALVQNLDDRDLLLSLDVNGSRIATIAGSGVDTEVLTPQPEPAGEITVGYVGRLLEDKGVRSLVEAHRLLRQRGVPTRLRLAGTPDPANPASIGNVEIESWKRETGVEMSGHVSDIAGFWKEAHIAALPSRREGLPKSLLEAAACGRPMVATDVPGCREVVQHGVTGELVPPNDPRSLAGAIARLAADAELRARYGAAARRLAVERFDSRLIGDQVVALYRDVLTTAR